jgi:hypothetical protein
LGQKNRPLCNFFSPLIPGSERPFPAPSAAYAVHEGLTGRAKVLPRKVRVVARFFGHATCANVAYARRTSTRVRARRRRVMRCARPSSTVLACDKMLHSGIATPILAETGHRAPVPRFITGVLSHGEAEEEGHEEEGHAQEGDP